MLKIYEIKRFDCFKYIILRKKFDLFWEYLFIIWENVFIIENVLTVRKNNNVSAAAIGEIWDAFMWGIY